MTVLFLSGPYASSPGGTPTEVHVERARKWAQQLWQRGYAVICPHSNSAFFPDSPLFLEGYLEILSRCDGVVMLPGWQLSKGARAEWERAQAQGLPVWEDLAQVP